MGSDGTKLSENIEPIVFIIVHDMRHLRPAGILT